MRVTVLGAGAWGTALAVVLHENGHAVTLWGHDPARLAEIADEGTNDRHLPGVVLPRGWTFEPDLARAVGRAEAVLALAAREEIFALFPELREGAYRAEAAPNLSATQAAYVGKNLDAFVN